MFAQMTDRPMSMGPATMNPMGTMPGMGMQTMMPAAGNMLMVPRCRAGIVPRRDAGVGLVLGLTGYVLYYLLAAKGVCVVPISSFCSELQGFRVTLLEEDEATLIQTFEAIRDGIREYLAS